MRLPKLVDKRLSCAPDSATRSRHGATCILSGPTAAAMVHAGPVLCTSVAAAPAPTKKVCRIAIARGTGLAGLHRHRTVEPVDVAGELVRQRRVLGDPRRGV